MFSISGIGKQLKSAAENFEQAGHALQARAAQQQQQQTPSTPPPGTTKNKKLEPDTPAGRSSGESNRPPAGNNALASRLSSLMAAKAARGAALERSASQSSADAAKEPSKPVIRKEDLAKLDPADIPLPPSPDLPPIDIPLPTTPRSTGTSLLSPELKPSPNTSLFNTPRNLVSKLPAIVWTTTPITSTAGLAGDVAGDGKRVDSERDLFSLGLSGAVTPALGAEGAGSETPGHTMADTEALLAKVDERAQGLSEKEKEPTINGMTGDVVEVDSSAGSECVKEASEEPMKAVVEAEDVTDLSREELEQKYKALWEKAGKADIVLKSVSPLLNEGIADADALEGWIKMINGKAEMGSIEIKRLNDKLSLQESRIEELRDTHRMEQTSSTAMIGSLRDQVAKNETSLSSQASTALQVAQLKADLIVSQTQHKEVDEKLTKAVNLLKTVRGKLVNVQRDREEVSKALDEEKKERAKLAESLDRLRAEKEREVQSLRQAYEKETQGLKDKAARESLAEKRKWELEIITTKATHAKDLASKSKHLNTLTESIKELNEEKRRQFELLQSRQGEIETATSAKEVSEARLKEIALEAREAQERATLAEDALADVQRSLNDVQANQRAEQQPAVGSDSASSLAKSRDQAESRLKELKNELSKLERERIDMEEEHGRQLRTQRSEIERVRTLLSEKDKEATSIESERKQAQDRIRVLEREREALSLNLADVQASLQTAREARVKADDGESSVKQETDLLREEISRLSTEAEDAKQMVIQAKTTNRNLREEMRRLQSSVQLLERQRNPGVGYWSAGGNNPQNGRTPAEAPGDSRSSIDSTRRTARDSQPSTPVVREAASPAPADATPRNEEEEVNLEYLRNVILQFLENKSMRPNLVQVLSVILRFTPQELRRLNAKLSS